MHGVAFSVFISSRFFCCCNIKNDKSVITTCQIYDKVYHIIEEAPTKLDFEHVTKVLIHLDSSISK